MYLYLEKLILDMGRLTFCSEHREETLSWQIFYEKSGQEFGQEIQKFSLCPCVCVCVCMHRVSY